MSDRLAALRAPAAKLNGIAFVEIASADQRKLRVHFINDRVRVDRDKPFDLEKAVTIEGVQVTGAAWIANGDRHPQLEVTVASSGDFSTYELRVASLALDRYYDHAAFSFKALCPSTVDCEAAPHVCPPPAGEIPPIDYLAKDFLSFRAALSDFSSLRYPDWQERAEPDLGVMFMEALSSLADDLSYLQDRIAGEASLETATERRSIVRHARLVDYEPRPAVSARVLLQFEVATTARIPAGIAVAAQGVDGTRVEFETGTRMADSKQYPTSPLWNRASNLRPYVWDDRDACLHAGSNEAWIAGAGYGFAEDQQLLIETRAAVHADPPLRQIVTLVASHESVDALFNTPITQLIWRNDDRLRADHDLSDNRTIFVGNLVPATQGRTVVETFSVPDGVVVRTGPGDLLQFLYTLQDAPLVWLPDGESLEPELALKESGAQWNWRRRIVDAVSGEAAFAIEPFRMRVVARNSDGTLTHDYDGSGGETIRFGDGVFGAAPADGAAFEARYRVGAGARGNVAADAIATLAPGAPSFLIGVSNPFAAEGGADAEPDERVRRLAPHAYRQKQFRAVRSEDYVAAAETLPWVSKAGSTFRWSGSWMTVFTTVDPRAFESVDIDRRIELIDLLNRYRLAGYESYTLPPRYASLDLVVSVCARSDAFRGDVEQAVREALSATRFFHADAFTFGTPIERSRLEAAVQAATGVGGVLSIRYRRRGEASGFVEMPDAVRVAKDVIVRVDSIRISVEGGK